MVDKPEVSRVVILRQLETNGLYVTPMSFEPIHGGGGYTPGITVYSSGTWTAEVSSITNTSAMFVAPVFDKDEEEEEEGDTGDAGDDQQEEVEYTSWKSTYGNQFIIKLGPVNTLGMSGKVIARVYINNSVEVFLEIDQRQLEQSARIVHVRRYDRYASLFNLKKATTKNNVYNLAYNMRDQNLFGPSGTVNGGEYIFVSPTGTSNRNKPSQLAYIYQLNGNPGSTTSIYTGVKSWLDTKPNRLLFISEYASYAGYMVNRYLNKHAGGGYTIVSSNAAGRLERKLDAKINKENKLVQYLLYGPFGEVENVTLCGRYGTNNALSSWPDTFIPIIMAGNNPEHCVFGIDPTNRLIWLSDPSLFGSSTASYINYANFLEDNNKKFLNNLIGWITKVINDESGLFIESYKETYNRVE
ncbi:MAG: hypothetical protein LUD15_02595 [Bacteroides sp.]|nr:hypothetical protein [Bacteroides sp.]